MFARGNRKQLIFADDRDHRVYLRLLGDAVRELHWICLSYCLMHNHVHLLIETPMANLSRGVQRLHGDYARYFNRRHDHQGHLFQGPFGAVRVRSDEQLWAVLRYIAMNPVDAGLSARPCDWRWGSWATAPDWLARGRLFEFLAASGGDPRQRYAELATATLNHPQGGLTPPLPR